MIASNLFTRKNVARISKILAILIAAFWPLLSHSVQGTEAGPPSDGLGPCAANGDFGGAASAEIDKLLKEIDLETSTAAMVMAHIELLRAAKGTIGYCYLEQRLRGIGGKTYLLALPLRAVIGDKRGFSITYVEQRFSTWSRIPKFIVWYERKGETEARRKLEEYGIDPKDNLSNLNSAGVAINAASQHPRFRLITTENRDGLNKTYDRLYKIIDEYRLAGNLDDSHNVTLMNAIEPYVRNEPSLRYSINDKPDSDALQFFVIDKDPNRLLINFPCSCAYIPKSNLILCDRRALAALEKLAVYGTHKERQQIWALSIMNNGIADLLIHWLIGHEIGHYLYKHDYGAGFIGFAPTDNTPSSPIYKQEQEADDFAFREMPDSVKGWGHMATNFVIQTLAQDASKTGPSSKDSTDIVIHDNGIGHPNLLTRFFRLKSATGAVDFLLEDIEKRTHTNTEQGAELPGLCAISPID